MIFKNYSQKKRWKYTKLFNVSSLDNDSMTYKYGNWKAQDRCQIYKSSDYPATL